MSYTRLGYPSAFASEGNPLSDGGFPGEYDPYVHTTRDRMDVDDENGVFSIKACLIYFTVLMASADWWQHMAHFAELAIAFAVEQAGWDNAWR